jgi:hypothetical protein
VGIGRIQFGYDPPADGSFIGSMTRLYTGEMPLADVTAAFSKTFGKE